LILSSIAENLEILDLFYSNDEEHLLAITLDRFIT